MRSVTASELGAWRRCRRKWWLTYHRQLGPIRPDTVNAAALGTLVHLGLEAHYTAADSRDPAAVVRARAEQDTAELEQTGQHTKAAKAAKQADLAVTIVTGYLQWLAETGADDDLEVIAAEQAITAPVPALPGVQLLGKLDLRVRRHSDGARLFFDHKTVQSIDQHEQTAHMSPQFKHYALLEQLDLQARQGQGQVADGERTGGAIVNMLRKVGRSATSRPPFYGRWEVSFNRIALRHYAEQAFALIRETERAGLLLDLPDANPHAIVPPTVTRDCAWDCPFKPVCPMFDDGSDAEGVLGIAYTWTDPLARYAEGGRPDSEEFAA
ncbi:hypothetical protein GCM10009760_26210 [Kitasatospora kazusensis]|uniref:PD-(D/E)XK endonuclease-like domain-containing protein n=1 Tax=Kitasatospora kazusensis TaxID=407974 RepID=A0ABN2ZG62_9ACTN